MVKGYNIGSDSELEKAVVHLRFGNVKNLQDGVLLLTVPAISKLMGLTNYAINKIIAHQIQLQLKAE